MVKESFRGIRAPLKEKINPLGRAEWRSGVVVGSGGARMEEGGLKGLPSILQVSKYLIFV